MQSELHRIADALRAALQTGDLASARELVLAYRAEFDCRWSRMSEEERDRSRLPMEALDLLQWARIMALAARQETDQHRMGVRGGRKYLAPMRRASGGVNV